MLKKEFRLIITFRDTVMAIRMEKAMKEAGAVRAGSSRFPVPFPQAAACALWHR